MFTSGYGSTSHLVASVGSVKQTPSAAQSTASCLKLHIFQITQVNKGHNSVLKIISPATPSVWDSPQQSNTGFLSHLFGSNRASSRVPGQC